MILREIPMSTVLRFTAAAAREWGGVGAIGRQIVGEFGRQSLGIAPGAASPLLPAAQVGELRVNMMDLVALTKSAEPKTLRVSLKDKDEEKVLTLSASEADAMRRSVEAGLRELPPRDVGVLAAEFFRRNFGPQPYILDNIMSFLGWTERQLGRIRGKNFGLDEKPGFYAGGSHILGMTEDVKVISRYIDCAMAKASGMVEIGFVALVIEERAAELGSDEDGTKSFIDQLVAVRRYDVRQKAVLHVSMGRDKDDPFSDAVRGALYEMDQDDPQINFLADLVTPKH